MSYFCHLLQHLWSVTQRHVVHICQLYKKNDFKIRVINYFRFRWNCLRIRTFLLPTYFTKNTLKYAYFIGVNFLNIYAAEGLWRHYHVILTDNIYRLKEDCSVNTSVSSANAVITIAIRLRHDYDPTTTYRARLLRNRRKQKMNMSIFRRSRIVVVSQSNRTHIVISITSVVVECVVVSSYRSRIVVESQL